LAPSPGTYRVRILRIGFKSFESPAMQLEAGERRYRAALLDVVMELPAVTVEAEKRCRTRPGEGEPVAALLEQAQTVLRVTEMAVERRLFRFRSALLERWLDADLRQTAERGDTRNGFSAWPHGSLSPDTLVLHGARRIGAGAADRRLDRLSAPAERRPADRGVADPGANSAAERPTSQAVRIQGA